MKYLYAVMALALVLSGCVFADAKRPIYMLSGGVALTTQPRNLKDNWPDGWHVSGGVGFPMTNHLTVRGMASYSHYPLDAVGIVQRDSYLAPWIEVEGTASKAFTASCLFEISFVDHRREARLSPFFFIGPCFHYQTIASYTEWTRSVYGGSEWIKMTLEQDVPSLGVEFGVGLTYRLAGRFGLIAEAARSVGLSSEPSCGAWIPIRVGLIYQ
jgi:hypothetical protein